MQYPNSAVARAALDEHIREVREFVREIKIDAENGEDLSMTAPLAAPPFPEPGKTGEVAADTIPTHAYNWCVSPMTPMAVSGVIWVPAEANIGYEPENYAAELEIFARSLPDTFGQDHIQFLYAQPTSVLVKGISVPSAPKSKSVTFNSWAKSLKELAVELGQLAK